MQQSLLNKTIELKPVLNNFYTKNGIRTIIEKYNLENDYELHHFGIYKIDVEFLTEKNLKVLINDFKSENKYLIDLKNKTLYVGHKREKLKTLMNILFEKHGSDLGDSIVIQINLKEDEIFFMDAMNIESVWDYEDMFTAENKVTNIEFEENFYGPDIYGNNNAIKTGYIITVE